MRQRLDQQLPGDPDGNGVELYYDRPREAWFDESGRPILQAERIPVESI